MSAFRERAAGYLREAPGGVNLERIAVYAALGIGAYLLYKAYNAGRALTRGATAAVNLATKPIAAAYVAATHAGVKTADGITYQLPDGRRIPASKASSAGGGRIYYDGGLYSLVAASPPGSGNYTVKRA